MPRISGVHPQVGYLLTCEKLDSFSRFFPLQAKIWRWMEISEPLEIVVSVKPASPGASISYLTRREAIFRFRSHDRSVTVE